MQDRNATASSVFFTGVSLVIEPERLRQHFESVGHVVSFTTFGPAPGKDFRYGIAGYMDPQTAEEAIRRLNGTTFGERAMRVTAARTTLIHAPVRAGPGGGGSGPAGSAPFRKRERDGFVPSSHGQRPGPHDFPSSSPFLGRGRGRGRGRGFGGPPMRAPMMPPHPAMQQQQQQQQQPSVDKDGRELMQLPRGFIDPVLGRDYSLVINSLRGMATEEAYAAVEQLRVLALERPHEARLLLENNPALKSAVLITLQHAGRLAHGSLPAEAYRAPKVAVVDKEAERKKEEQGSPAVAAAATTTAAAATAAAPPAVATTAAGAAPAVPLERGSPGQSSASVTMPAPAPRAPPVKAAAPPAPAPAAPAPMTEQERDEVLELIQSMSEEDVERVLTMSARDLAQIPDMAQRKQLELLQRRLVEMSRDL